ncbi:hypothetical protein [Janthinobacterium sp. P210006]|uniref:hypothetical protein n=1 Tax=Janthinobacterium sp. P210006 TaxID=3112939 RepID=UPI002E26186B|nr:hypothetical protein [Janthinobacterium sp. P210006]
MAASIMLAAFFMHENDASQHQALIMFRHYLIISRHYLAFPSKASDNRRRTKIVHLQNITNVKICNIHGHLKK